ncbi:MAG: hypothetical protein LC130_32320 [Bryobacterales bacterium]|nr:hypothetical protein [Bryobacterales bacterium]
MTPLEFLNQLWQYKPDDQYILIWTLPDKRSRWFTSIPDAAEYVAGVNGSKDVYVGLGLAGKDYGPMRRCVSGEVTGIAAIGCDFDLLSEAHGKKALPRTVQEALSILPPGMEPSFVVLTGNGLHCWWLLKEPCTFETDAERSDAARVVARWHTLLRLRAAAKGWAYDRLSDLARVLRIPGTVNHKDPVNPKKVTLLSASGRRYNLSDFEEYLDEAAIPDPEAEQRAAREWAERFQDKPLVLNFNARIPEETLQGWMDMDLRFRNTWLRQRHDLKDQSQSGYDLALACFGTEAGLSEQQIVDLIIHHRALHNQRQRTRLDYYQRTLATASRRMGGIDPVAVLSGSVSAPPAQPEQPQADSAPEVQPVPDPATSKAVLCERISQVLGVRILRLIKVTGKEPTYQMELETATVEFPNVGRFIDQASVRVAIASATNKLIPKVKPKVWEQLAQTMLDALIETEGGDETDFKGSIRMYVNQYLTDTGFIETIEDQPPGSTRCPTIINGRIAICSSDLQPHVNKNFSQTLSVKAIASMLAAIGARNVQVKGKTFKPQSRWLLPVEEFDPADFTMPSAWKEAQDAK